MSIIHNLIARFRADTGTFDRNVNKSRQHMTRFGKDMQRVARQLLAFGGGYVLLNRGIRGAVRAFMEQEKAERALIAATNQNINSFKQYAAGIQKLTIYGDEQILTQMAYAKNLGVTTDQLEEATTAAIGLAAKYRLDLASAMMLVGRASQGQTQMLTRYGIVLDDSLNKQEKFNAILKLGAEAFHLAEAETETLEGRWEQFKNAAGDFAEEIVGAYVDVAKGLEQVKDHYAGIEKSAESAHETMKKIKEVMPSYQANLPGLFYYPFPTKKPEKKKTPEEKELEDFARKWNQRNAAIQAQIKAQIDERKKHNEEMKAASEIAEPFLNSIKMEIELTGKLGEARQHAAQIIKLEQKLKKEGLKDTIAAKEKVQELRNELDKLAEAQKLERIAQTVGDSFASAFEKMIFEAEKFRDVMKSLVREIGVSVFRNLVTEPISRNITMALGGVPATVAHAGGTVGQIGRKRNISALAFAGAPKLHNGLMGNEYPAILQRGEQVIPRGGMIAPQINIFNENTGTELTQGGQPFFDGEKWVVRIVAKDIQSGGTLRNVIGNMR